MNEDMSDRTKRVLAMAGVGAGVAGSGLVAGSDRGGDGFAAQQQVPDQVLVFAYEYNPGLPFEVINRVQQGTVDSILGRQVGENGQTIVSDTADYNGYIVRFQPDQEAGEYAIVFVREDTLQLGSRFSFQTDATFFNTQANLLTAGLSSGSADGGQQETETTETETTETETTAPAETTEAETTPANETTTQEVLVNETTTEGGGGG